MSSVEHLPKVACSDFALIATRANGSKVRLPFAKPVNFLAAASEQGGVKPKPHVVILNSDNELYIRDLTGRANLRVNGWESPGSRLVHGDRIALGKVEYEVSADNIRDGIKPSAIPPFELRDAAGGSVAATTPITVLGTDEHADIRLESKTTALGMILLLGGRFWLWALEGTELWRVNDQPTSRAELVSGTWITIGQRKVEFRFLPEKIAKKNEPLITPKVPARTDSIQAPAKKEDMISTAIPQAAGSTSIKRLGPLAFAVASANKPDLHDSLINSKGERTNKARGRRYFLLGTLVVLLLALGVGGFYAWQHFR
jgi:hypothetical protein